MSSEKIDTIKTYDQNAKQIAEQAASDFAQYQYLVDDFLVELRDRQYPRQAYTSILDLGCGSGEATAYMHGSSSGVKAIGVDLSEGMLEEARKKNVQVRKMDIENLDFAPEYFDGIWSMCSLVHLKKGEMLNVLRSLHKILKADGRIFICLKLRKKVLLRNFIGSLVHIDENDGVTNSTPAYFSSKDNRYFSYWSEEEFLEEAKPLFKAIISSEKTMVRRDAVTTFLWFILKKT